MHRFASRPAGPKLRRGAGVFALALAGLLWGRFAPPSAAWAGDDACRGAFYTGELSALFVAPRELGVDWDGVRESPAPAAEDPELREAQVRATQSLHYTRPLPDASQVCSLEIWSFASGAAARSALPALGRPGWRLDAVGNLVLMTRGVSLERASGFRPGLLPECVRLADLARDGARETLGCARAPATLPAPVPPAADPG